MKKSFFSKVIAVVLTALMLLSVMPLSAFASEYDTSVSGDYFTVISSNDYNLCNGATESELILNNSEGNDRKVVHVFEVDTKNPNVQVLPGYYGIDKLDPDNLALYGVTDKSLYWNAKELTKTVAYYEGMGYNVVGAMNTALAYDSNAPYGYMVMNGVVLGTPEVHKGAKTYLAIDGDGNCELRAMSTPLKGNEVTAISANFDWLVKDGKLTSTSVERTSSDASRSMIGIKADGTLVFCQVDGRNAPVSTGLSNYEMGEMMLSLGCVNAVNCDGGGSSTFVSKREGESSNTMRSIPSDGSERATINSVIIVSNAKPTGEFDHAVLDTQYDYYAPGTSATIEVQGVDSAGSPAELPEEGITWSISDDSFGTVADGVFKSNGKKGNVTVNMLYNDEVVGEKLIRIVDPDVFALALDETVLPYGKSMNIDFNCTYGVDNWAVCVDGAYTLELSDIKAATIDGTTLTASNDYSLTGVNLTATYIPDPTVSDVLKITFGKGSEIIFDFEDGERGGFVGFQEAKQYSLDNGINNSLVGTNPLDGQFSETNGSVTYVADASKGEPVKNGNYALAWSVDNTNSSFAQWTYNVLFNIGDSVVLRDVANGQNAIALGMWLYIPEGAAGLACQSQMFTKTAAGGLNHAQTHFTFTTKNGTVKNLNSCTEADIPESRWVYAKIDISSHSYLSTAVANDTTSPRSPSFLRTYVKPTAPANLTFYIDDITLDYSSAVDDRVLPTISNVCYADADTAIELADGAKINSQSLTFSANVADNIKLDNSTAKIFVDGNKLPNVSVSGKYLASEQVSLLPGTHTVAFEIADTLGNLARVTRTFTITGDAAVSISGHNDSALPAETDSIYYVDVNVADIADINKLSTDLFLQTANTWEPQGISIADGFKVDYQLNEKTNVLSLTVERNGEEVDADATTLVSIPVRVWSWSGVDHVTGKPVDANTHYATGDCPVVTIQSKVLNGSVEFAKGYKGYVCAFGGNVSAATNINDIVYPWHTHDAELTVLNKDVTCTTDGYTNRTYCESCKSVVDWGTTIKAEGHNYKIVNGTIACECGAAKTDSGMVELDGNTYYAVAGKLVTGWIVEDGNYYYFDTATYAALKNGRYSINGYNYSFDENGVHTEGQWVYVMYNGERSAKYYFAGKYVANHFQTIGGKEYWFNKDGILLKGIQLLRPFEGAGISNLFIYDIDEDGVVNGPLDYTGVYNLDGTLYYVIDGKVTAGGVVDIDGDLYYVEWNGVVMTGKVYVVAERTNGLVNAGWNYFDENGKLIDNDFAEIDGSIYYVVNGQPAKSLGAIEIDGNVYFVNGYGIVETGKIYIPANMTNGIVNAGYNYTDETGRFYNNEFADIDGKILYVVNGQPEKTGTSEVRVIDGGLYFVEWNGNIPTGKIYISANEANGLTSAGWHYTDETGRLYDDEFATIDGKIYYMVKGLTERSGVSKVREVNGELYFIEWNGLVTPGKQYICAEYTNGLTTAGWHYADETGRLYDNEFATIDGKIYYMVHGQMDRTGVSKVREVNGELYFIEWNGLVTPGKQYIGAEYTNGLTTAGWHYADETGRLYNNEFATIDGKIYYMVHGQMERTGVSKVREINGGLYFVEWNGLVTPGKQYICAEYTNGLTAAGWHYADETGRLYDNEFATINGAIYYMVDGMFDNTGVAATREINGKYYFVEWNGHVATGKVYTENGWRYTDETGAFYNNEIATINGSLYYVVDGAFYTGGVFEFEGDLYFAMWNGKLAANDRVYLMAENTNDLIISGYHTFDAEGKMVD